MKKLTTPMLFLLIALFSCSKKDAVSYNLTSDKASLQFDETSQFKINIGTAEDYVWKSSDDFVGTIDNKGRFTAAHIGETIISIEKEGKTVSNMKITVSPKETFFVEPFLEFGQSISHIKSKEKRKLQAETASGIAYSETTTLVDGIFYFFEAGKLKSSLINFADNTSTIERSKIFYDERYNYEGFVDGTALYTSKDNKILIGLSVEDSWGYGAICIENTSGTTNAKASLQQAKKALNSKVVIF